MADRDAASGGTLRRAPGPDPVPADRRVARGHHTRLALIDAAIDLFQEGILRPTSRQLAERAQVSVRTFFNHFHIDALYGDAASAQVARSLELITPLPPRGPIAMRIRATCRQRRQLFEEMGLVLHAAQARPTTAPALSDALDDLAALLLEQMQVTFAREISRQPDRAGLFVRLDLYTGWESWSAMRYHRHQLSPAAAERQLEAFMNWLLT